MRTIIRIKFGSHLYGTSTLESDLDYKSVFIPKARDILLQRVSDSFGHKIKNKEHQKNSSADVDDESYSLQRFLQLVSEGQTVALDMLFAPEFSVIERNGLLWNHIQTNRERLLTKKSAAFLGYCRAQANKYGIKGSRVAAAKAAMELFGKSVAVLGTTAKVKEALDFGRVIPVCPVIIDDHTRIVSKETPHGGEYFFECCNRMVGFNNTLKSATEIFSRIYENYGKRAQLAKDNQGIDWKALSHAVRVGYEALELLHDHHITFPLASASHLIDIKKGRLDYAQVAEEIEELLVRVEEASLISTLPESCDQPWIDDFICSVYKDEVLFL